MADLGERLAERHEQLSTALLEAQVNETTNPKAPKDGPTGSASIQAALDRIEAHDDYKAHVEEQARLADEAKVAERTEVQVLRETVEALAAKVDAMTEATNG
jgi:hypothetical protein